MTYNGTPVVVSQAPTGASPVVSILSHSTASMRRKSAAPYEDGDVSTRWPSSFAAAVPYLTREFSSAMGK
jgi:hypothetical protein